MSKTMAGLMIVIALIVGGVGGAMTSRPVFTVAAAGPDVRTGLQESFAPINDRDTFSCQYLVFESRQSRQLSGIAVL
jgi:hypothetical protein